MLSILFKHSTKEKALKFQGFKIYKIELLLLYVKFIYYTITICKEMNNTVLHSLIKVA